ncbi:MAG: hypothetical protein KBT11_10295 [Treponema sp.]|nr:hypothetical protein [Candidatus Treponema equifaecale]
MLKHKLTRLAAVCMAVAGLFLNSCKSAPVEAPVDPVELLDDNGAIYLTVPVQPNLDFVTKAIVKIAKCNSADAEKISKRINNLYIEIGTNGEAQISGDGDFPSKMLGLVLTEKNGWLKSPFQTYSYYTNKKSLHQLSIPSSSVACISRNAEKMLSRYDNIAKDDLHSVQMEGQIYEFLKSNNSKAIQVYAPVPGAFIKTFIGANVNTPVESISGVFTKLPEGNEFGLKIILQMKDPRTVKAACAALKIALFPVPAKIVQTGSTQITVTDITLTYNELLAFLK